MSGAGRTLWTDHPKLSVWRGEALGIALATSKAHSADAVPTSIGFMATGDTLFPPSYGSVGLDVGQTYGVGPTRSRSFSVAPVVRSTCASRSRWR